MTPLRIGTAGWAVPQPTSTGADGSSRLERYSRQFDAVEINSSFHRPHRRATYERWASSVPKTFQFSVKVPKLITHALRLRQAGPSLMQFLAQVEGLGQKLAVLLVQLPPSLAYEPDYAAQFFSQLRSETPARVVCEPRHATWFDVEAEEALRRHEIARAGVDPAPTAAGRAPSGDRSLAYFRLHGSPRKYYSRYELTFLRRLRATLLAHASVGSSAWCVFDNTAAGAAWENATELQALAASGFPIDDG